MKTVTFVAILAITGIILLSGCVEIEPPVTGEFCVKKESGEKLSLSEAKDIAIESECGDRLKDSYFCNEITGTWWIDLSLEKEGCNPACVVDVATKEAKINWRCMGLLPAPIGISEEKSKEIAREFVLNSPTYKFDGFELKYIETITARCPSCWLFKFKFSSRHGGYGDRTGKILAQVITPHLASVIVEQGKVTHASLDGKWDMIKQIPIQLPLGGVPIDMIYQGTKYVNCKVNPNYPFQVSGELSTISGLVKEELGSKMFPWRAAVVDGHYLFNSETGQLLYNFQELIGKRITIKGYPTEGQITMKVPFESGETKTITFDGAFYVSEIVSWRNICCDATLEDTGIISTPNICFWFENGFVPGEKVVKI